MAGLLIEPYLLLVSLQEDKSKQTFVYYLIFHYFILLGNYANIQQIQLIIGLRKIPKFQVTKHFGSHLKVYL